MCIGRRDICRQAGSISNDCCLDGGALQSGVHNSTSRSPMTVRWVVAGAASDLRRVGLPRTAGVGLLISPHPDPTEKTVERSPFFFRRGGHCCLGDLVARTTFCFFFFE